MTQPAPDKRRRQLIGAGIAAASTPFWFNIARAQNSAPIKIGFPTPLTGAFSAEAQDQKRAAELAVKASMAAWLNCWCATTSSTPAKRPPARWS